jgi:hypothetical protein
VRASSSAQPRVDPTPLAGLIAWRAYLSRIGLEAAEARQVGRMAFCAAASWPVGVIGVTTLSWLGLSMRVDLSGLTDTQGEIVSSFLFTAGGCVAITGCWKWSRTIARTVWMEPSARSGAS